jgi:hypothetical protein
MEARTFEIRDRMTFIPVLAVRLDPCCEADRFLIARGGYGIDANEQRDHVVLIRLASTGRATSDPYEWNDRTMQTAHEYIAAKWPGTGSVIDVRYILGEAAEPCESEQTEAFRAAQ